MASVKREQLLDMAIELFFKRGCCHTVGIDTLLAEAGVAKMTLYAHFKSKEDLILAAAERLHDRSMSACRALLDDTSRSPRERLYALFDYDEKVLSEFPRCPFQGLAVEFGDPEHPIHRLVVRHLVEIEALLTEALRAAGVADPAAAAKRLMVISQGAKVMLQITGEREYYCQAKESAQRLVEAELPA